VTCEVLKTSQVCLNKNSMKKIPQEHQDLVMARVKEAKEKPEMMLDWDEVSEKLNAQKSKKPFDVKKFNGVLRVDEDGLAIQKRIRDEWE
jgi:hypothetical protein